MPVAMQVERGPVRRGEMEFRGGEPLAQGWAGAETEHCKAAKSMDSTNILRTEDQFCSLLVSSVGEEVLGARTQLSFLPALLLCR